jgi:hypothetical protein
MSCLGHVDVGTDECDHPAVVGLHLLPAIRPHGSGSASDMIGVLTIGHVMVMITRSWLQRFARR